MDVGAELVRQQLDEFLFLICAHVGGTVDRGHVDHVRNRRLARERIERFIADGARIRSTRQQLGDRILAHVRTDTDANAYRERSGQARKLRPVRRLVPPAQRARLQALRQPVR